VRRRGVFIGTIAWTRGKGPIRIWRRFGGDPPGVRRVCPRLYERDDRWAPLSVAGERREGYRFGSLFNWAAGYFLAWAERLPRGLFFLFFFFSLFFSVFFCILFENLQITSDLNLSHTLKFVKLFS
jgi:hypothetical protein